ncbi:MAG: LLM class flavin-dependent oxidoreductase [Candidatus Binatia bacterium]
MRFGFLTEGDTPRGASVANRYHEVIREAQFAEQMGFDFWGCSEQHFTGPVATISAPEVLLGAVAQATSRIKIRTMSFVMLHLNHPIRSAERLATLDILSNGRMEFGTARGNNAAVVSSFKIDADNTKAEWRETLEVIVKALTTDPLEHHGRFYDIDPTNVWPRLYQREFPPIYLSSTSIDTHIAAGKLGIGPMHASPYGWEYLQDCIDGYKKEIANATPIPGTRVNNAMCHAALGVHCAATREQALYESRPASLGFNKWLMSFYGAIAKTSPEYAYMADVSKTLGDHADDLPYLADALPWFLIGTPDECIERLRVFQKMGIDEIIVRIDGFGHKKHMDSIEMFGKYVLPEFKNPGNIVRVSAYEEIGVAANPFML